MGKLMTLRALEEADIPQVAALESANQPRPWSPKVFADEIERSDRRCIVAEDESIVGFGGVMLVGDEAHVTNLLVDPARRGEGIGRSILTKLVSLSIDSGAEHLTLEVRSTNKAALELYRSFGLAPVGVRPKYYGDDDALIMWAHDISTTLRGRAGEDQEAEL